MSLYRYVPGKAELLDLMLDTVFGEERRSDPVGGVARALERWRATPGRSTCATPGCCGLGQPAAARPERDRR